MAVLSFFSKGSGQQAGCPTPRAPDVWDSAAFSSIFLASSFSCSQTESQPAHTQVTQTVGRQIKEQRQNRLCIASVAFRLAQKENSLFEFGHLLAVVLAGFYFWFTSVLAFNLLGFQI